MTVMPSERQIYTYLKGDDWELWLKALAKTDMKKTDLLREIVHCWLFSNRIQLEGKK